MVQFDWTDEFSKFSKAQARLANKYYSQGDDAYTAVRRTLGQAGKAGRATANVKEAYKTALKTFQITGKGLGNLKKLAGKLSKGIGGAASIGLILATDLAKPAKALTKKEWAKEKGPAPMRRSNSKSTGKRRIVK